MYSGDINDLNEFICNMSNLLYIYSVETTSFSFSSYIMGCHSQQTLGTLSTNLVVGKLHEVKLVVPLQ